MASAKTLFWNKVTFLGTGVRVSTYIFFFFAGAQFNLCHHPTCITHESKKSTVIILTHWDVRVGFCLLHHRITSVLNSFCTILTYSFFKTDIYLFIYLFLAVSGLSCSTQDLPLQRTGFSLVAARRPSSCGTWAPECVGSVVVVRGPSSCGTQAPECVGSVVAASGPSCPAACGILVPQPGMQPASPALQDGFFTTGPPGKSHILTYSIL